MTKIKTLSELASEDEELTQLIYVSYYTGMRLDENFTTRLDRIENLDDFYKLGMFERNNWNTRLGILPTERARWIEQQNGRKVYNPAMAYLPKGVKASVAAGSIPQVMTLSTGSRAAQSEYVMFSWNNPTFSVKERKEMASKGDFSFINR